MCMVYLCFLLPRDKHSVVYVAVGFSHLSSVAFFHVKRLGERWGRFVHCLECKSSVWLGRGVSSCYSLWRSCHKHGKAGPGGQGMRTHHLFLDIIGLGKKRVR